MTLTSPGEPNIEALAWSYRRRVGQRIKDARQKRGLSQLALTKAMGVNIRTLQSWESGEREPTVHSRVLLAHVLDVDFDRLFSYRSRERTVPEPDAPPEEASDPPQPSRERPSL